jgi:hypothetical protein
MKSPASLTILSVMFLMALSGSSKFGTVSLGTLITGFFSLVALLLLLLLLPLLLLLLVLDFLGALGGCAFEEMLELLLLLLLLDFASILLVIVFPPWPGMGVSRFHTNIRRLQNFFSLFIGGSLEKRVITRF